MEHLDAIVLSHGHYDHTGGLGAVQRFAPKAPVFAHPAALTPKFSRDPEGSVRFIGMPLSSRQAMAEAGPRFTPTPKSCEVVAGLFVTGEIPRRTEYEDVGGPFFLDEGCQVPDPLVDDQAVFFQTGEGVVVLLGCAHAGVVNTLKQIGQLTSGTPVRAVLGGMHLLRASPERLAATIEAFRQHDLALLSPVHCSGFDAVARLWQAFPQRCVGGGVGYRFVFGG